MPLRDDRRSELTVGDGQTTADKVLLKDLLFHPENISQLAAEVAAVHPRFPAEQFVHDVCSRLAELELKQRIAWMSSCLYTHLPTNYPDALGVLLAALPPPCDETLTDGDFGDFIYAPYSHFVATYGCTHEYFDMSLEALRQFTTRFSAEDAIRPFINAFPEATFEALLDWTADPHYHVRRLCSEGTRPLLPWAKRLNTPIDAALPILHRLYTDPTRYVTRSVANHLNDIGKSAPDLVADLLETWRAAGLQNERETDYIIRHSTRTLVKLGNPRALRLIGVEPAAGVSVNGLVCTPTVAIGEAITFQFDLVFERSLHRGAIVIDYRISFPGPTGRIGQKIYKLRRVELEGADQPLKIEHRHLLRAGMTTRQIIAGTHRLEILINGQPAGDTSFAVIDPR